MAADDGDDPTVLMLSIIFGTLGLFIAAAYAANWSSGGGARAGPPKKRLGAKQRKRQILRQGLQIPTE